MTQSMLFDVPCTLTGCKSMSRPGGFLCQSHWLKVPDRLKIRLARATDDLRRARADVAIQGANRAVDIARQACIQAAVSTAARRPTHG